MRCTYSGYFVLALALAALGCGKKQQTLPGPDPTTEFHGTWKTVPPTKREHEATIKFEEDVLFLMDTGGGSSSQSARTATGGMPRGEKDRYAIFTAKKAIDVTALEGDHEGKTRQGIYEFEGDRLKICLAAFGQDRPTDFTPKPGAVIWVLERKK